MPNSATGLGLPPHTNRNFEREADPASNEKKKGLFALEQRRNAQTGGIFD